MTVEYILILCVTVLLGVSTLSKLPRDTMARGGAKFAARVEAQLGTGQGFQEKGEANRGQSWSAAAGNVVKNW